MKKILYILIFTLAFSFTFAQDQDQYSISLQNSNVHEAIISPVPMYTPNFFVRSEQLITRIEVINLLGKKVYDKKIQNFTFSPIEVNLPPIQRGIYFVKITFDDNTYIIKKTIYK